MNNIFYLKLAITNIKKNRMTYIPYILTCVCTIMMFFMMHSISVDDGLDGVNGSQSLKRVLYLGAIVIGIFSVIFLLYTNSFLIKKRKKEIGLYNILGLEKKHIARVLFHETLIITSISLFIGLVGGVVLNKLMFLLLLKLLKFPVLFGFYVSKISIIVTIFLFISIFMMTLLFNLLQIKLSKPIELLKGSQVGEKEPKSKWSLAILGLISMTSGYAMALTVETPLAALNRFFIAVILVMIGTYALFTSGSIALLKILRKNKKFYYQTKNFISTSSLIYRMKQNAVGLANICILSTAVLVMLSTTVSLYIGMEDALRTRFPRDVVISGKNISEIEELKLNELINANALQNDIDIKNKLNYWSNTYSCTYRNGHFQITNTAQTNLECLLYTIKLSDYNRLEDKNVVLSNDEVMIFSSRERIGENDITIEDNQYHVVDEIDSVFFKSKTGQNIVDTYVVILNDLNILGESKIQNYTYSFDLEESNETILSFTKKLQFELEQHHLSHISMDSAAHNREGFLALYGGLFFIGIFLGILFLMATVLIIYYKQISEGFDDKKRFEIMQKVGINDFDIKKTIKNQVLIIFFLPLCFTIIHTIIAFPITTKLLALLNLTNVTLFIYMTIITIIIFTIIYGIVFSLTARMYYKIVK